MLNITSFCCNCLITIEFVTTGVGKSETAYRLAEALLSPIPSSSGGASSDSFQLPSKNNYKQSYHHRKIPGSLILQGGELSENSFLASSEIDRRNGVLAVSSRR